MQLYKTTVRMASVIDCKSKLAARLATSVSLQKTVIRISTLHTNVTYGQSVSPLFTSLTSHYV
jgi:hypothetical protein